MLWRGGVSKLGQEVLKWEGVGGRGSGLKEDDWEAKFGAGELGRGIRCCGMREREWADVNWRIVQNLSQPRIVTELHNFPCLIVCVSHLNIIQISSSSEEAACVLLIKQISFQFRLKRNFYLLWWVTRILSSTFCCNLCQLGSAKSIGISITTPESFFSRN